MPFLAHLSSYITISESLEKEFKRIVSTLKVQKNDTLMRIGQRCDSMYFITKGLVRGYYYEDDKEITTWFAKEDEFATCFYSFVTQTNAVEYLQALESTEILILQYKDLQSIYSSFPETERMGRLITEEYYIKLEERFLNNQFKSAKERYRWLSNTKPDLLQRAPLGHIASYLGITQETLSRIRAEL